MGQKRIHLVVRGRVQDVYFRASTLREARRLGLTGWVRNRADGAVEMVAEGEEDQVKDLLAWAQTGPSTARVDKVDTRWRSYTGEYSSFRIMTNGS
ncbi:MAG: acylphosphatase [Myxococcales bacterium]|nr:acylphosphatase [Myxococcales bacterium]MDD9971424.1 acylphosphatase [Myxococcales bacterium]